jgi:hypothetical protein
MIQDTMVLVVDYSPDKFLDSPAAGWPQSVIELLSQGLLVYARLFYTEFIPAGKLQWTTFLRGILNGLLDMEEDRSTKVFALMELMVFYLREKLKRLNKQHIVILVDNLDKMYGTNQTLSDIVIMQLYWLCERRCSGVSLGACSVFFTVSDAQIMLSVEREKASRDHAIDCIGTLFTE